MSLITKLKGFITKQPGAPKSSKQAEPSPQLCEDSQKIVKLLGEITASRIKLLNVTHFGECLEVDIPEASRSKAIPVIEKTLKDASSKSNVTIYLLTLEEPIIKIPDPTGDHLKTVIGALEEIKQAKETPPAEARETGTASFAKRIPPSVIKPPRNPLKPDGTSQGKGSPE